MPKQRDETRPLSPYSLIFAENISVEETYGDKSLEDDIARNQQSCLDCDSEKENEADYYDMAMTSASDIDARFARHFLENLEMQQSISMYDSNKDQFYFFNPVTGKSTWEEIDNAPCRLLCDQFNLSMIFTMSRAFYDRATSTWENTLVLCQNPSSIDSSHSSKLENRLSSGSEDLMNAHEFASEFDDQQIRV